MHILSLRIRALVLATGIAFLAFSGWAGADPPSRVARLGYIAGAVSFSPGGEDLWVEAAINRPLTTGDRLWVDADGRAELQIGGAVVRMNANTGVSILNLDDRVAQVQLTQGSLNVRVRRLESNQFFEVDTPNLAFTLRQPGTYRIEVDPEGIATTIVIRKGKGEVYGEGVAYVVDASQPYRFTGTDLRAVRYGDARRLDDFDRWANDRDRQYDDSVSARYVSQDVIGYQDLDAHGTWRVDATYGNVWTPNRVGADWAPYRDGHWSWIDPWGWTWVDDAPWGFAVSHYGRWANLRGTWGWVPGPVRSRAYYAPALVAFVGGANFQLTISSGSTGGVGWFPLAPREVYRPSYAVSRGYFENINRSNTVINTTVINNYYNNTNVTNVVYANREVSGAIVAVPVSAFVQSQPVSRSAVRVSREMIASAPVSSLPAVAPTERSVRGAAGPGGKPPPRAFERPAVARTAPPAARAGFAAQSRQLAAQPGKPLDDSARRSLPPAPAAAAPVVTVVEQARKTPPTSRPPQAAPQPAAPARMAPQAPAPVQAAPKSAPQAAPPAQAPRRDEPRAKPEPREKPAQAAKPEQREKPPQAAKPEQREKPPQAAKHEQREKPPQAAKPAPQAQEHKPAADRQDNKDKDREKDKGRDKDDKQDGGGKEKR